MVRERSQGTEKASIVYPFTVNGEPYVPSARPSLESGQPVRLCLVAYNLGDGQPALEIAVLGDGGRPVPGGRLALIERTLTGIPGLDKLLASFETDGLASGSYTLRVALQDPATGVRATSSIPFSIAD
jgi:hypothetical protein